MAGLPPVVMPCTNQATLIVVRGCHVILTLRASPAPRKRRPDAPCRKRHGEPGGSQIPGSVRDSRSAPWSGAAPSPGRTAGFHACIAERRDGVEIQL